MFSVFNMLVCIWRVRCVRLTQGLSPDLEETGVGGGGGGEFEAEWSFFPQEVEVSWLQLRFVGILVPSARETKFFLLPLRSGKYCNFLCATFVLYEGMFLCLFVLFSFINAGRRNACGLYVPERGSDICYESVTAVNGRVRWPPEAFKRSFWALARVGNSTTLASCCSRSSDLTMHCLQSVSEIKWMVFWTLGKTEVWGPVDVPVMFDYFLFFHTS